MVVKRCPSCDQTVSVKCVKIVFEMVEPAQATRVVNLLVFLFI